MPNFQEQLDQIPLDELGGREGVYNAYSAVYPLLEYRKENSSYALRQALTIEEGEQADTEEVNLGVAVLWYTDNLLYAENDMGRGPESGFYSGKDFFLSDSDIEFVLEEDFTEDDANALEKALEP